MDHYRAISDYGVIGNLHTAALVSSGGSIDWACLPYFDSPAFFCRLLDINVGGYFQIHPVGVYKVERTYLEKSNILSTTFSNGFGKVRLIDLMPISMGREEPNELLRKVEGVEGEINLEIVLKPTPQFAAVVPIFHETPKGIAMEGGDPLPTLFYTNASRSRLKIFWEMQKESAKARIRIKQGEAVYFLLDYGKRKREGGLESLSPEAMEERISRTLHYWQTWAKRCRYHGPYEKEVLRSALTLKLLTFAPTGGIVAAATTSLPETVGGVRNWDYRFAWLRDAALTLYSLMALGYQEEAHAFMKMMMKTCLESCAKGEPLQIMYRIDGNSKLPEEILSHLEGYRRSYPVRVGNAASEQLQMDVFGELLSCLYTHHQWKEHPLQTEQDLDELLCLIQHASEFVLARRREPDHGIWEFRDQKRDFVHSKVMTWVTLDRAIKLVQELNLKVDTAKWGEVREEIKRAVLEKGYDPTLGSFVQAFDEKMLDASALLFPILGFISADDPKMASTLRKIQETLMSRHFLYRYIMDDGLPGREGAFIACSFWLVDALILMGRRDEAQAQFERLLSCANDLGLYSEEIDPITEEQLGNFPQAFTHVALINAAVNLEKAKRGELKKNM